MRPTGSPQRRKQQHRTAQDPYRTTRKRKTRPVSSFPSEARTVRIPVENEGRNLLFEHKKNVRMEWQPCQEQKQLRAVGHCHSYCNIEILVRNQVLAATVRGNSTWFGGSRSGESEQCRRRKIADSIGGSNWSKNFLCRLDMIPTEFDAHQTLHLP